MRSKHIRLVPINFANEPGTCQLLNLPSNKEHKTRPEIEASPHTKVCIAGLANIRANIVILHEHMLNLVDMNSSTVARKRSAIVSSYSRAASCSQSWPAVELVLKVERSISQAIHVESGDDYQSL